MKICKRLIRKTSEYKESEVKLTEIKNRVIKILELYDIDDKDKSNN